MKLLLITQKVSDGDSVLGFFHGWIVEFAKQFESISVVCLEEGKHNLPTNVSVYSLGKEKNKSRVKYLWRFYKYIWNFRHQYDVVFVHMNQEYVLLGFLLWRLFSKKILFWRNHAVGNFITYLAAIISHRVFYTSQFSYTARFKNARMMPAGIDTSIFKIDRNVVRQHGDVLCLGRLSPVKGIEKIIKAYSQLTHGGRLLIVGEASPKEFAYVDMLKKMIAELGIESTVKFLPPVAHHMTVSYYQSCHVYINVTQSGSLDKTILEAMACGAPVLVTNKSFVGIVDECCVYTDGNISELSSKLDSLLALSKDEVNTISNGLSNYVEERHSLIALVAAIKEECSIL